MPNTVGYTASFSKTEVNPGQTVTITLNWMGGVPSVLSGVITLASSMGGTFSASTLTISANQSSIPPVTYTSPANGGVDAITFTHTGLDSGASDAIGKVIHVGINNEVFRDNFNRSNGTPGFGWLAQGANTSYTIANKRLANSGATGWNSDKTHSFLYRPTTSNPATLIPGTNEGSINQRFYAEVNYADLGDPMIFLRANPTNGDGFGFLLYSNGTNFYIKSLAGTTLLNSSISGFDSTNHDTLIMQGAAYSTDSTHTLLTFVLTDKTNRKILYSMSQVFTSTGVQSTDVSSTGSGFAIAALVSPGVFNEIRFYTDQAVQANALQGPVLASPVMTSTTSTITISGNPVGTSPYFYEWYRSTTLPTNGIYGKKLVGQNSSTLVDTGLQSGVQYWWTCMVRDSSQNPAPAITTISGTTMTASSGPSTRPSMVMWADVAQMVGQTNGTTISQPFGQFFSGDVVNNQLTGSKVLPTYESACAAFQGKPALNFTSNSFLRLEYGDDVDVDAAIAGSFTVSILYSLDAVPGSYSTLLSQCPTGGSARLFALINSGGAVQNYDGSSPSSQAPIGAQTDNSVPPKNVGLRTGSPLFYSYAYNAATNSATIMYSSGVTYTYTPTAPLGVQRLAYVLGQTFNNSLSFAGHIVSVTIDNSALSIDQMISDLNYYTSKYSNTNKTVICVGDSLTMGADESTYPGVTGGKTPHPYPTQMESLLTGWTVYNCGVSGQTTGDLLNPNGGISVKFSQIYNPFDSKVVVPVLLGVNDFLQSVSVTTASSNYIQNILNLEKFTNIRTIVLTEVDSNNSTWETTYRPTLSGNITSSLPPVLAKRGVVNLATNSLIGLNGVAAVNNDYWYNGLHMTGEDHLGNVGGGYGIMATLIAPQIITTGNEVVFTGPIQANNIVLNSKTDRSIDLTGNISGGTGPYQYTWYFSNKDIYNANPTKVSTMNGIIRIDGGTSSELTLVNLTPGTGYYFRFLVRDANGKQALSESYYVRTNDATSGLVNVSVDPATDATNNTKLTTTTTTGLRFEGSTGKFYRN